MRATASVRARKGVPQEEAATRRRAPEPAVGRKRVLWKWTTMDCPPAGWGRHSQRPRDRAKIRGGREGRWARAPGSKLWQLPKKTREVQPAETSLRSRSKAQPGQAAGEDRSHRDRGRRRNTEMERSAPRKIDIFKYFNSFCRNYFKIV